MNRLAAAIASFFDRGKGDPARAARAGHPKSSPFLGVHRVHVSGRAARRGLGNHNGGRLVTHKPRPRRDPAVAARMAEIRQRPVRRAGDR